VSTDVRVARRTFLKHAGFAAIGAGLVARSPDAHAQVAVPNSTGTARPTLKAPANACDCHHHIYDAARFPPSDPTARFIPNATVVEYRLLQRRLGITRHVVVTPAPYVGDNRVTVDALRQFGKDAVGVALLRPDVSDAELKMLHAAGVCGVRFSLGNPGLGNPTTIDMIDPLTKRVMDLGWHAQVYMRADQIVANEALLNRIPNQIVFDHMGILLPTGTAHAAFPIMRRLIDAGRTWVKLSGPGAQATRDSSGGYTITYDADLGRAATVARAFIKAAPERMLWGSNWPHPGEDPAHKPDDAAVFDLLAQWESKESIRHRILVDNPEAIYGFARK
jgi:D-galactarolactone isomerase